MENNLSVGLIETEGREQLKNYLVAAAMGDLEFINYSIESGRVGVDETYKGKPSALSYACMKGHVPLIQLLVNKGADVNYLDTMGCTPLHYAALSNCPLSVDSLLQHGASPSFRDYLGRSALSISSEKEGCAICFELLHRHTSLQPQVSSIRH